MGRRKGAWPSSLDSVRWNAPRVAATIAAGRVAWLGAEGWGRTLGEPRRKRIREARHRLATVPGLTAEAPTSLA